MIPPAELAFVILILAVIVCSRLLLRSRRQGYATLARTGVLCTLVSIVSSQLAMVTMVAAFQAA